MDIGQEIGKKKLFSKKRMHKTHIPDLHEKTYRGS